MDTQDLRIVSLKEFLEDSAQVVSYVEDSKKPVLVTKHGVFFFAITPLDNKEIVESCIQELLDSGFITSGDDEDTLTSEGVREILEEQNIPKGHFHSDWRNDHSHFGEDWVLSQGKRFKPTAHKHEEDEIVQKPSYLIERDK